MTNPSPAAPPPAGRSKLLTALLIIVGIVLLLPGLCTLALAFMLLPTEGLRLLKDPEVWVIIVPCMSISALGVFLLVRAARKRDGHGASTP